MPLYDCVVFLQLGSAKQGCATSSGLFGKLGLKIAMIHIHAQRYRTVPIWPLNGSPQSVTTIRSVTE